MFDTGESSSSASRARDIDTALTERPGAVFLRADLQVHTPVDSRFEPRPEPQGQEDRRKLAEAYLTKAKERGIELVGITEHNDVSWIEELRRAAKSIGIHLLPGFEVESREGVHILCLFDPDTAVSHLEDTLVQLGLTEAKRRRNRLELRTKQPFAELLDLVQSDCGGICIAAHIESDKGLLSALRQGARVDAWKTKSLLAAQLSKPPRDVASGNGRIIRGEDPKYRRERLPGYVLTSDCRSLDTIGTTSTWIKMDSVGVSGLRQAFLDPESRISYENPDERHQGARLLAASWEGGFLDGVAFPLNPELNCLIGGKGTGKSTVIETIRYALDLDYGPDEIEKAATELRSYAFSSGSKVSIAVETESPRHRYLVERTAPHAPVVRNLDGTPRPDLDASTLLRPRVYGQKEIFAIAQNAQARLGMVDSFAESELREIVERERDLTTRCAENGHLIAQTLRRIDDAETKLAELPNLEEWRARFREAGFEHLLSERRRLDGEDRMLRKADDGLATLAERAVKLRSSSRAPLVAPLDDGDRDTFPNADLIARAEAVLVKAENEAGERIDALAAGLERARAELEQVRAEWARRRDARSAEFDKALRTLQDKAPDVDPERYLDVERRIEQLMPLRTVLSELRSRLDTARHDRSRLLIDLADARGAKHRVRQRAADRLNESLRGTVLIQLEHQGVRQPFVERLAGLKTNTRQEALRGLVEHEEFTPVAFAEATRGGKLAERFGMPAGQASNLERSLGEETLLELELDELPDRVMLSLDIAVGEEERRYRDLSQLSPGQKSTAILLLVMQESSEPLIVDQPEDDLDNRFIYDDIVKRLKEAKRGRQFLIATHNANIPVLGDAEQIVALDAEESSGSSRVTSFIRAHGSIDSSAVRDAAEHILEGGHDAFALRQAKYEG